MRKSMNMGGSVVSRNILEGKGKLNGVFGRIVSMKLIMDGVFCRK